MWTFLTAHLDRHLDKLEAKIGAATYVDLASLCCFRIIFGLFTILFLWRRYVWLGTVPDAFFKPPIFSFAALFNAFPSPIFFHLIDVAFALLTVTLTIGFWTRFSTVALLLLTLVGNSFYFSFGFINHEIMYLCVLGVMCFRDWGAMFSVDSFWSRRRPLMHHADGALSGTENSTADLWLLAVLIAFGFFTAGFGKALSWMDFDLTTSGFLSWFYGGFVNLDRDQLLAPLVPKIQLPLLWELVDISAVMFELGCLAAIWTRRSWYGWLTIACFFHLMNCLLLNISFTSNAVAYLAFVPWSQMPWSQMPWSQMPWSRIPFTQRILKGRFKSVLVLLTAFCTSALVLRFASTDIEGIAVYFLSLLGVENLFVSCAIWSAMLVIFLMSFGQFVRLSSAPMHRLRKQKLQSVR